jgi:hypothetical protein
MSIEAGHGSFAIENEFFLSFGSFKDNASNNSPLRPFLMFEFFHWRDRLPCAQEDLCRFVVQTTTSKDYITFPIM